MADPHRPIHRVIVSVFDKKGLETLAEAFIAAGTEVVSTGSTALRLEELGVEVTPVEKVTGFPESLDGRVKTLDPHIHAGILADMENPGHAGQLEALGIKAFDAVIVNLYPFAQTVRSGAGEAAVIEKIDIGGPSMIRGAAKNSSSVAVITDPQDYSLAAERISDGLLRSGRADSGAAGLKKVKAEELRCPQFIQLPTPVHGIWRILCDMVRIRIRVRHCIAILWHSIILPMPGSLTANL